MKLKQIIEDEFGDLDDKDEFGPFILEIDPKSVLHEKRDITLDNSIYIYEVEYEFVYNGVLVSNVYSIPHDPTLDVVGPNWWIDNVPLDLIDDRDKLIEILKKLDLDDFISNDTSNYNITMFLYDVLDDTASSFQLSR